MKKALVAAIALAAVVATTAVAASPASANSYLPTWQAQQIATSRAKANWNPPMWSEGYGYAWDKVTGQCIRWTASRVNCVMSADMSDYAYNAYYGFSYGYAYCVGTVNIARGPFGGYRVWATDKKCDASA
jgi:hypothetical protein